MENSESNHETEQNRDNIYNPNTLAKQIIGVNNNQENKGEENLINKSKEERTSEKNNSTENKDELSLENNKNKKINNRNDFDYLNNNEDKYSNDIITNQIPIHYNNNLFVARTSEAIKMEFTNQKRGLDYRKYKFNGITVVQNLKDYIPQNISKQEIKEMIFNAFGEGLVDDMKYYIPGKTITRAQANVVVDYVEKYIKEDINRENIENENILKGTNLVIDLVDLNKDIIRKKMFKGKNPSDLQLENTLKNLSQGSNNVKILSIEFQ